MPSAVTPPAPQLQVLAVVRPRNQLYLDQEVAGIWRPLAVSGRAQHPRQVALQPDFQLLAVRLQLDGFDQRTDLGIARRHLTVVRCAGHLVAVGEAAARLSQLHAAAKAAPHQNEGREASSFEPYAARRRAASTALSPDSALDMRLRSVRAVASTPANRPSVVKKPASRCSRSHSGFLCTTIQSRKCLVVILTELS